MEPDRVRVCLASVGLNMRHGCRGSGSSERASMLGNHKQEKSIKLQLDELERTGMVPGGKVRPRLFFIRKKVEESFLEPVQQGKTI